MTRASQLPLGRLAAEFTVIVVGVLVALGVDGWVAGLDERDQESAYLAGLRADFVMNRALAENGARVEGERAELAVALLESLGTREPPDRAARTLLAAEMTGWFYYSSYAEGAWSDLQATGSTRILRDAALRVAISDFYRALQWVAELDAELREDISSYQRVALRFIDPRVRLTLSEDFPGWEGLQPMSLLERLDEVDMASFALPVAAEEALAAPLVSAIIALRTRSDIYSHE